MWGRLMANKYPYGIPYRTAVRDWAISKGAKHAKLNVLTAILESCNKQTGTAYPGNNLIKKRIGTNSNDTLQRALVFLEGEGIIVRKGCPNGGRGLAVEWGFGLPAWTTPDNLEDVMAGAQPTPPENRTENRGGKARAETKNLTENAAKPHRKCGKTSPDFGEPTGSTKYNSSDIRGANDDNEPPSRRQVAPGLPQNEVEQALFSEWHRLGDYGQAKRQLAEWRHRQSLAAE